MSNIYCNSCNCKLKIEITEEPNTDGCQWHDAYYLICNSCNTREKIQEDDGK